MHPDVVKQLLAIAVPRLAYISCNPATQARDFINPSRRLKVHYDELLGAVIGLVVPYIVLSCAFIARWRVYDELQSAFIAPMRLTKQCSAAKLQ